MSNQRVIEVRGFKWPNRPAGVAMACLLGEDAFGRWLGVTKGDPWWTADRSRAGVFDISFVKLVPNGTFWTACFNPVDPVIDVDIVLPVRWIEDSLEEVDLELDILRFALNRTIFARGIMISIRMVVPGGKDGCLHSPDHSGRIRKKTAIRRAR